MADHTVEISVNGQWHKVAALDVDGAIIVVERGTWIRVAVIHAEEWLETGLDHPEVCVERLTGPEGRRLRADIFTFSQRPPATRRKYSYPMEWDSIAALHVTSFKEWWDRLPQE